MAGAPDVLDLGALDGPVFLFGGAYSNLQALEAVLAEAARQGFPAERIIHTGDVVAYCAQPRETTERLRASGVRCLMGNCEESIGASKLDCGCGFPEDSKCNEYSVNWFAHVTRELEGHDHLRAWMAAMPRRIEFVVGGRRLAVVHGSPRGISEFVWPSTSDAELRRMFAALPERIDGVVCGHSGIPFARVLKPGSTGDRSRLWLNAGVVGMPANDGTQRGWYSVLTPSSGKLTVDICALSYDANGAAEAIYARPQLVRGYADSLISGVWPSHDILPLAEQMATGVELLESKLDWEEDSAAAARARTAEAAAVPTLPPVTVAALVAVSAVAAAVGLALSLRGRTRQLAA